MAFFDKPPQWLTDLLPEDARGLLDGPVWWAVLGVAALVVLLIVWGLLRKLQRAFLRQRPTEVPAHDVTERLSEYPPLMHPPGARRLTFDGVPVRVRLVVVAPAGTDYEVNKATIDKLLDRVVPGLSAIAAHDRPQIRVWPGQLSHTGFAVTFHRATPTGEPENEPSHWVLVAGRAKIGTQSVMLGLALWADEPTTLFRRNLEPHQWLASLRVKGREG